MESPAPRIIIGNCSCWLQILLFVFLFGCSDSDTPNSGILFKNDIQDREYNTIELDRIRGGRRSGSQINLDPGQKILLGSGVRSFRIRRKYAKYIRTYTVECPAQMSAGIVVKLIDIHLNRIAGGCITTSYNQS